MKRLDDDHIILTQSEVDTMYEFIRDTLARDWDHYTDTFISSKPLEVGMKQMNPEMYEFANKLIVL